ncbi:hypothetical protein HZH66_000844 [Vespula vulgaris]|uniref:Uncharacterized protein n=1 Tax=Vespula vulgaris TaxID=7454 RepID=A0A834NLE3_VESVU|nr:hypothetical protein HZH66_000844 [Vespula vulgaris]
MYKEIADIFVLKTISPIEKYALMTQLRNNNEMEQKSTREPIELIHMDLCGFMPTKSLEGNKYVYVLLDEYSRDTWVYVMKRKGNKTFIDTTDISTSNIKIEESEAGLSLFRKEYINKILIKYDLKDYNSAKTPMSL